MRPTRLTWPPQRHVYAAACRADPRRRTTQHLIANLPHADPKTCCLWGAVRGGRSSGQDTVHQGYVSQGNLYGRIRVSAVQSISKIRYPSITTFQWKTSDLRWWS